MGNYKYILSNQAHICIYTFYINVAKKYVDTYSYELMCKNINDAMDSIYRIENRNIET